MKDIIEQKYNATRPHVSQIDMEAVIRKLSAPQPGAPETSTEERNIQALLDVLFQVIEQEFGPLARIRVEKLDRHQVRILLRKSLPDTLSLEDPDLHDRLTGQLTSALLDQLRAPLETIIDFTFPDWEQTHAQATVFDIHAHPGLKAQWFQRDLSKAHDKLSLFQKLTGGSLLAFNPLSVRTSFPKLQKGQVNVMFSTLYALEKESLFDLQILPGLVTPKFLSRRIVGVFRWLSPVLALLGLLVAGVAGYFGGRIILSQPAVLAFVGGILLLLVTLAALVGAITLLTLQARWILPVFIKQVVEPDYFKALRLNLKRMEDQAVHAQAKQQEVTIAHSVEELEEGLRRINQAKRQKRESNVSSPEPLVLIHALEGAHCLQGPLTSEKLAKIKQKSNRGENTEDLYKAIQSSQAVEDEIMANLMTLYRSGVAMIGLAHYYPNIVCQSVFSYPERAAAMLDIKRWEHNWHDVTLGLTRIGTKVIQEMLRLGIIIDITHTSPTTRRDVYDLVDDYYNNDNKKFTVAASHIGVQGVHTHPYNLADWELEWLAQHGGVIGIMWSNYWLSGHEGLKLGLGYIGRSIDHVLNVLGEEGKDLIGFGSDLDGFSDPPDDLWEATRWPVLTQYLAAAYTLDDVENTERRFTSEELRAFLGGNMLKLVQNGWGRQVAGEKSDLIAQLGSLNNRLACEAADQLRKKGWLSDGTLQGANLRNANLAGCDLTAADLRATNLRGSILRGANLAEVRMDSNTILPDGTHWKSGIDLTSLTG